MTTIDSNEPGAAATVPQTVADELRRAAIRVRAVADNSFADELADWLEHTADNMDDEKAYEVTRQKFTGSFTEVVTDSHSHLGVSDEWTAALLTARKINESQEAAEPAEATGQRVSDERLQEILDSLNGFVSREYDGGTHIVNGAAVPCAQVAGCDANLDKAVAWAEDQPDVEATSGPLLGEANLRLVDGTFIEWLSDENQWAVTVSDDAEAVAA